MPPPSAGGPGFDLSRGVLIETLEPGESLIRVHAIGKEAVFFGPPGSAPRNRFDAPAGEYKVLYAAQTVVGAFVETVLRRSGRLISRSFVEDPCWTDLRAKRTLRFAKVHGEGLLWHGVDASVSSADRYAASQALALALHATEPDLDGLSYRSRHNNGEVCYACFDRVSSPELIQAATSRFDQHRDLVDAMMAAHGAAFDTSPALATP